MKFQCDFLKWDKRGLIDISIPNMSARVLANRVF